MPASTRRRQTIPASPPLSYPSLPSWHSLVVTRRIGARPCTHSLCVDMKHSGLVPRHDSPPSASGGHSVGTPPLSHHTAASSRRSAITTRNYEPKAACLLTHTLLSLCSVAAVLERVSLLALPYPRPQCPPRSDAEEALQPCVISS